MKRKIFIIFLMMLMVVSSVKALECDANLDGKLDSEDGNLIQKITTDLVDAPKVGSKEFDAADCNKDGKINLLDSTYIQQKIEKNNKNSKNKVNCGNVTGIPKKIPELVSFMITAIYVAIPIILVIMGSIDFFKGITAGKEDEIKKGQHLFLKRLIISALIFFVSVIVKFIISVVADSGVSANITSCIDCFINGKCK